MSAALLAAGAAPACGGETDSSPASERGVDGGVSNGTAVNGSGANGASNGAPGSGAAKGAGGSTNASNGGVTNGGGGSTNGANGGSENDGGGTAGAPSGVCTAGETTACVCQHSLQGVQTCRSDGSGYSGCDCTPAPTDASMPDPPDGGAPTNPTEAGPLRDAGQDVGVDGALDAQAPPTPCDSDTDCTALGMLCDFDNEVCVAPPVSCETSLDCVDAAEGRQVCEPTEQQCVQCLTASDCSGDDICVENACVCHDCGPRYSDECVDPESVDSCDEYCEQTGALCSNGCGAVQRLCGNDSPTLGACSSGLSFASRCCCDPSAS